MSTKRWIHAWDDQLAITGSVYVPPTFSSGPENGLAERTAPSTAHIIAGQGVPARVMNYAWFQTTQNALDALRHKAMGAFTGSGNWASNSVLSACFSRTDRGFVVGTTTSVCVVRDGVTSHALTIMTPAVGPTVAVLDDGSRIWEYEKNAGGGNRVASSSTVTNGTSTTASLVLGVRQGQSGSMLVETSGAAMFAQTLSGTALSPVGVPGGTYNSSTLSLWGSVQSAHDSTTATGPMLFYAKGVMTNDYLYSPDGLALSRGTMPVSTRKIADVAYDDVQSLFVMATYSTTGSALTFYTSADGLTGWTLSSTASGPANLQIPVAASDGSVAFKICCGVWFVALTSNAPPNYIYGQSGGSGLKVFGFYSLDFGQTWYPSDLDMAPCSAGSSVRIVTGENRFLVYHDSDVAISGRLGYNTTL